MNIRIRTFLSSEVAYVEKESWKNLQIHKKTLHTDGKDIYRIDAYWSDESSKKEIKILC